MFGFGSKKPIDYDHTSGNPHVIPALRALEANDWETLERLYYEQHPSDRDLWLFGVGTLCDLEQSFPETHLTSAGWTIQGALQVAFAGRHRGSATADRVSDDAASKMFEVVSLAEKALQQARQLAPDDCSVYTASIRCSVLGQWDEGRKRALIRDMLKTPVPSISGAASHLTQSLEKWGGSQEEMWETAKDYSERGPNAAWLGLMADAYLEDYLWHRFFLLRGTEEETAQREAYLKHRRTDEFRAEIAQLDDQFNDLFTTEKANIPHAEQLFAHNQIGCLLYNMDMLDRAKSHIDSIGPHFFMTPWGYFDHINDDKPMAAFNRIRKRVGLKPLLKEKT